MVKPPSHQLHASRWYQVAKAGKALVEWLNKPGSGPTSKWKMDRGAGRALVQELLIDAQVVFHHLNKYKSGGEFIVARKDKKLPPQFSKSYDRLNDTLGTFTHVPRIELNAVYDGNLASWAMTDDSPIAHVRVQVRWLLQVIGEGEILSIRRCQQCENWFFARVSHHTFCKPSCQKKDFSQTEDFKVGRREYMRKRRLEERNFRKA
jgi:hypothetical protein